MDIYDWTEQQRNNLANLERGVNRDLARAYAKLTGEAGQAMADYRRRYDAFVAANGPPPLGVEDRARGRHYAFQMARMEELAGQLAASTAGYYETSTGAITTAQAAAVKFAQAEMRTFADAAAPAEGYAESLSFATLPDEAVRSMVGFASDGTPLDALLRQRAATTAQDAKDALISGVAFGEDVNRIADRLDGVLSQSHYRNLLLARTETARAHHEAVRVEMLQNADLIAGWRWSAAVDEGTCPICWANHNRVFPLHDVAPGDPSPLGTAQHKGLEGMLQRGALEQAGMGKVDADTLPEEAKAGPDRLANATRLAERATYHGKVETVQMLDSDGNVFFTREGSDDAVNFTDAEVQQFALEHPGAVLTHNHPYGWRMVAREHGLNFLDDDLSGFGPDTIETAMAGTAAPEVWRGNSLSTNDLKLAYQMRLSEIRAVSPGYVHSMKPAVGQRMFEPAEAERAQRTVMRLNAEVRSDFMDQIRRGVLSPDQAEARHFHEVMTRYAAETGTSYSRIPIAQGLGGFTDA